MLVNIPEDIKLSKSTLVSTLPVCGVVATAVVTKRNFVEVRNYYASTKRSNWKGALYSHEIIDGIVSLGGEVVRKIITNVAGRTLKDLATRLDSNKVFVVFATGHVVVLHGGKIIDQAGVQDPDSAYHKRKYAYEAYEVIPGRNDVKCEYKPIYSSATISKPKPGTKLDRAYQIYSAYKKIGVKRRKIIYQMVDRLDISEGTAAVYYHKCTKIVD